MKSTRFRSFASASAAALTFAVLILGAGCKRSSPPAAAAAAPRALEVGVISVQPESLTLTRELPGRTSAFRIAEVRARVSGIVQQRAFTEGADVKEGDVLFQIDPAPYEAALDSARATLARAEAALAAANALASRYEGLVATNAISKQTYDDTVAGQLASRADVAAAQAAVRTAEINLGYTRVTSPINGRIGRAAVTEGAYVQQGAATLLATVQQLDPLYVDLSQSAEEVLRLRADLASGRLQQSAEGSARLTVILGADRVHAQVGSLQFSDVSVNPGTGTVALRGTVPNPGSQLLPGLFVRARLDEGTNPSALLIPQSAVTRNAKGEATALVVGAENKVELRILEASRAVGNRWLITGGLQAGDQVIVDHLQKIRPGVPVKPIPVQTAAR